MKTRYDWSFPLPRTHTGMLLGNATLGAMIWGEGGVLRITVGRADFWDHRGGMPWTEKMSYAAIRDCLQRADEEGLRKLFEATQGGEGIPHRPSVLPVGRIELDFGSEACLTGGRLDIGKGVATVTVRKGGVRHKVRLVMAMDAPLLAISFPECVRPATVRNLPAWEDVGEYLKTIGFKAPRMLAAGKVRGWVQERPADPPLCVAWRLDEPGLLLTALYGRGVSEAQSAAKAALKAAADEGYAGVARRAAKWWKGYWRSAARIRIPNDRLQFLYNYGMYKFAGLTNPDGVAATLQGPWIEEYQMPPWSSDYHFNINVQMCYWPAYHGNRLENLRPLWNLIGSWTDTLRHNAKVFLGIDDGLMLPHSVDDTCVCMGGFWTGSIDHGCTAWVAQMMYRYYRYTMDKTFLKDTAWPFMVGAMRVYECMLEREGDRFVLPVSVSPEYRGAQMNAWGRNASFQLACIHRLCEDLIEAAAVLGEAPKPVWSEIREKLPKACLIGERGREQIALWEGVPLEESHRHHSHLGGVTPFDIFGPEDPDWGPIIGRSMDHWVREGTGLWSGWCVPWAAMLHLRQGAGAAAELLLEAWQRVFTNEGHGTLHDAHIPGFTLMGQGYAAAHSFAGHKEVMQIEAGMSATTAIQEMLLHTRRGVNHVFTVPKGWKDASFRNVRTDGAFLVSGRMRGGRVERIRVESPAGGVFKLANPWTGAATVVRSDGRKEAVEGAVLAVPTRAGETFEIEA